MRRAGAITLGIICNNGVIPASEYGVTMDDVGGMIGDEYIVAGYSQHAYGVLEGRYKKDLSIDEGIDIILSALNAVTKRGSASGDGIDISIIDKQGYKILEEGIIKNRLHILEGNHG